MPITDVHLTVRTIRACDYDTLGIASEGRGLVVNRLKVVA